jgi:hypothetical protein
MNGANWFGSCSTVPLDELRDDWAALQHALAEYEAD